LNARDQRLAHAQGIQGAHHLAEVADAGEQNLGGGEQARRIAYQGILAAQFPRVFCTLRRLPAP